MENHDKSIQELIDYLIKHNSITSKDYRLEKSISDSDWSQVKKIALERDYMIPGGSEDSYFITQKGKGYGDNRHIEEMQKERNQNELQLKKALEQDEAVAWDRKLKKWQVKVFWPGFAIAVIGGLLGVATFIMKVTEKPKTNTKYIGVDGKGHVIEFTIKD